jgi:hypothetical protein
LALAVKVIEKNAILLFLIAKLPYNIINVKDREWHTNIGAGLYQAVFDPFVHGRSGYSHEFRQLDICNKLYAVKSLYQPTIGRVRMYEIVNESIDILVDARVEVFSNG